MRRPGFIARQARDAKGPLGRLIAAIMARETRSANAAAIEALAIGPDAHVLDIGCGPGHGLQMLADRAPRGTIAGVDPSALMAEIAVRRNAARVRSGQVSVSIGTVEALPFADACFDGLAAVHVVYFWPDLQRAFAEIARVAKPGAVLALVYRTPSDPAARAFPADVYAFRSSEEIARALADAGFAPGTPQPLGPAGPTLLAAQKRS